MLKNLHPWTRLVKEFGAECECYQQLSLCAFLLRLKQKLPHELRGLWLLKQVRLIRGKRLQHYCQLGKCNDLNIVLPASQRLRKKNPSLPPYSLCRGHTGHCYLFWNKQLGGTFKSVEKREGWGGGTNYSRDTERLCQNSNALQSHCILCIVTIKASYLILNQLKIATMYDGYKGKTTLEISYLGFKSLEYR